MAVSSPRHVRKCRAGERRSGSTEVEAYAEPLVAAAHRGIPTERHHGILPRTGRDLPRDEAGENESNGSRWLPGSIEATLTLCPKGRMVRVTGRGHTRTADSAVASTDRASRILAPGDLVLFQSGKGPWVRWAVEFSLILASVFLAVFLENARQAGAERRAAQAALEQLLGELREDHADFLRIIEEQEALSRSYSDLDRWLGDGADYPPDSVGAALVAVLGNPTLFTRRASWTTMVSAGQLAHLDAPELVLQLGQLYETSYGRLEYNSRFYDEEMFAEFRSTEAMRWDNYRTGGQPLVEDPVEVRRLAGRLSRIHSMWTLWYRDLLLEYEDDVLDAIVAVEQYLATRGP